MKRNSIVTRPMFLREIMVMHDLGDWEEKEAKIICDPTVASMHKAMQVMFDVLTDSKDSEAKAKIVKAIDYQEFIWQFHSAIDFIRQTEGVLLEPTDTRVLKAVSFSLGGWGERVIFREITRMHA